MMIVDNILNKEELLDLYKKMLDRDWYLSRGSITAGKWNKYGENFINNKGHTFPGYVIKSQKSGRITNNEDYNYFESLLPKISDKCFKKYGIKLPTNIFRLDIVAKQRGARVQLHKDHGNPNAYSLIGLLTPEWKKEWGGDFYYNDENNKSTNVAYHNPGSFLILKSNTLHNGMGPKVDTPYWRMIINYVLLP